MSGSRREEDVMNCLRLYVIWCDRERVRHCQTTSHPTPPIIYQARIRVIFQIQFRNCGDWRIQGWDYVECVEWGLYRRGSHVDDYNGSSLHYFWLMNYGPNWLRELWSSPSRPDWSNSEHKDRGWSLLVCYLIWIWPICLIISIKIFFW